MKMKLRKAKNIQDIKSASEKLLMQIRRRYSSIGLTWNEVARLERQAVVAQENDIRRFECGEVVILIK